MPHFVSLISLWREIVTIPPIRTTTPFPPPPLPFLSARKLKDFRATRVVQEKKIILAVRRRNLYIKKHSGERSAFTRACSKSVWIAIAAWTSNGLANLSDSWTFVMKTLLPLTSHAKIPGRLPSYWIIRRQKTYWWTARSAIDLTITYITLWLKTSIDIYPRSHL